jgi:hypothetical protein
MAYLSWNAQVKDRLEDKLHELVCSGQLDLTTAQQAIASNWIEACKKYLSPNPPIPLSRARRVLEAVNMAGQVWVNARSGKARVALLWQNQTGPTHVRRRSNAERLSTAEWYRRMTSWN